MAIKKYTCPPQPATGAGTFSDNIVGFQLVDGGGFTQGNFEFTESLTEKKDRDFNIGSFSDPINLESLDISLEESRLIQAKNFQVYPNFDLSQVTNFTLYGSLVKRISTSITNIINYFPAAIESSEFGPTFNSRQTVKNITYDSVENETTLEIPIDGLRNPFDIDYTVNATRNLELREIPVSYLRNFTTQYTKYILEFNGNQYDIIDFIPTTNTSTSLVLSVNGNPFSGNSSSSETVIIRPNDTYTNKTFNEEFDEVEKFLLNRQTVPQYTASFKAANYNEDGSYTIVTKNITFPKNGSWNLDITSTAFTTYLNRLSEIASNLDTFRTNLVSRFLITGAFKEFDTDDQKIEKILQIYGRSFDETMKFILALPNMNNVHYIVKNDIPSQLLKNLAETLGWKPNISPITNESLLDSVFKPGSNDFSGVGIGQTPEELNYQYYRNLILNSAYLFKSKGTRKSIEILLRLIGAPEALIDFNEYIYVADQKINLNDFDKQYTLISGGTYSQELPVLDTTEIFSIMGVQYTGFTTNTIVENANVIFEDYPIDENGYPSMPIESDSFYYQIGGGWFESTPQHRMPEKIDQTNSVFTGSNPNYQTVLQPFNYGEEYLDRYRNFPYMNLGFKLRRVIDNKKSWTDTQVPLRQNSTGNFNAYYEVGSENLTINVKNVDIHLNPAQGLAYDVYTMSRTYDYPIPNEGLGYKDPSYCDPIPYTKYPQRGGVDWTEINPKPKQKTFFEFAQTFWRNMINVRNRQFITDGKTGGYPTLQSIYWKYLESEQAINIPNDNFTYQTMIDYVNGLGDYWIQLIEQMVPATTIWNTGVKYENSIFHRQKFVWRRQSGCKIIPVPCNGCSLIGQLFVYDCPVQKVECGLYPWTIVPTETTGEISRPSKRTTFGTILNSIINNYLNNNTIDTTSCDYTTITSDWYIDIRLNDDVLISKKFFSGVGDSVLGISFPTNEDWVNGVLSTQEELENYGISFIIYNENETITFYNNNCIPMDIENSLEYNVGINFEIFCNN
jgi:hypothetical protein